MNRTLRKFIRDGAVTILGVAALFLAENFTSLNLDAEVGAIVVPLLMVVYRFARERSNTLANMDDVR